MRVIFLDIDGVLNSRETPNPRQFPYVVDPTLLARFLRLVQNTAATVVLSSTWRVDPVGRLAAQYYGVPFDDICPDNPEAPRCQEMRSWLAGHPEVTRYIVIDDEDDCLDKLPLFQPSANSGLTDELSTAAEDFLLGRRDIDYRQPALVRLGQNLHAFFKRDKS